MFSIAGREVGPGRPPLVIAELGINHGGDLALARAMIDAAARAGAEVIKHQTHIPKITGIRHLAATVLAMTFGAIFSIQLLTLCR